MKRVLSSSYMLQDSLVLSSFCETEEMDYAYRFLNELSMSHDALVQKALDQSYSDLVRREPLPPHEENKYHVSYIYVLITLHWEYALDLRRNYCND